MKRMAAVIGTAFAIGLLSMPAAMDVLAADITEARAKEIAMEHAGVSEKKIPFIKAELDHEDGKQIYEVKFHTRDREEYEYEIDVSSGKIEKRNMMQMIVPAAGTAGRILTLSWNGHRKLQRNTRDFLCQR